MVTYQKIELNTVDLAATIVIGISWSPICLQCTLRMPVRQQRPGMRDGCITAWRSSADAPKLSVHVDDVIYFKLSKGFNTHMPGLRGAQIAMSTAWFEFGTAIVHRWH